GACAAVVLGSARASVPIGTLQGVAPGESVDLFVRPEDLRVAEHGAAIAARGTVATQVYQGGHIDLHVDVPEAPSGRVLLRLPGHEDMARWPAGTPIGIALIAREAVAFSSSP